ncbi:hypothetical protein BKA62DRAFT_453244 [Auriculariales sp. MPI-PUGE-AT-0066]|nr:hypothetical protein BKA62DRAFT_453244 [Auriculariales sp. MPI-PUGE-AT-0066]
MSSHGPAIKKSFLTYVATLRSHYKNHLDPPTNLEGTLKKAQNRRNTGGNNLMDWRVDLIGLYPALEVLMPQGTTFRWCFSRGNTSDDDELPASDDETKLVHKIHEYEWRNPRVTAFLHALDARGRHLQRMQRTNVTRERFISKSARILSNRGPCLHLPEDWYDETWLRNLKENDALSYSELRVAPPANTNWDTLMEFLRVR